MYSRRILEILGNRSIQDIEIDFDPADLNQLYQFLPPDLKIIDYDDLQASLYTYLLRVVPLFPDELQFVLDAPKILPGPPTQPSEKSFYILRPPETKNYLDLYTQDMIELVKERDAMVFALLGSKHENIEVIRSNEDLIKQGESNEHNTKL